MQAVPMTASPVARRPLEHLARRDLRDLLQLRQEGPRRPIAEYPLIPFSTSALVRTYFANEVG